MTREEAVQITDESIYEVICEIDARKELSPRERECQIDILLDHRFTNIEMLVSLSVEAQVKRNRKILSEHPS